MAKRYYPKLIPLDRAEQKRKNDQMEKRWKFAEALEAAIKASEGVEQEGWDVPITFIREELKGWVRGYGYGRERAALEKTEGGKNG